VSLPTLLSGFCIAGVAGVVVGGFLAVRSDRSEDYKAMQTTAGLLLIAGFACFGVALSLIFGSPLR